MKRSSRMKDDELLSSIDRALEVLDLNWPPTKDEIAQAFRKKAFTTHPDRGGTHEAMMELNNASDLFEKDILVDQQARKRAERLWQQRERTKRRMPGRIQTERQQRQARERTERGAWERVAQEAWERAEREERERIEREKQERAERQRQEREREEREEQERAERLRQRRKRAEHRRQQRKQAEQERQERERAERERLERERRKRVLVRTAIAAGLIVVACASYAFYSLL